MGSLGMPELIMMAIVLLLLAVPVGIVILVVTLSRRKRAPQFPSCAPSAQERLLAIDDLRARNLLSEAEHAEQRQRISGGL